MPFPSTGLIDPRLLECRKWRTEGIHFVLLKVRDCKRHLFLGSYGWYVNYVVITFSKYFVFLMVKTIASAEKADEVREENI